MDWNPMEPFCGNCFKDFFNKENTSVWNILFGPCTSTMENIYGYGPLLFDKHSSPTFGAWIMTSSHPQRHMSLTSLLYMNPAMVPHCCPVPGFKESLGLTPDEVRADARPSHSISGDIFSIENSRIAKWVTLARFRVLS